MRVTSVFVTHDQEEALEVADRVVVMNRGRIEQAGTPQAVYDHPATAFVYEFLGHVNRFPDDEEPGNFAFARPKKSSCWYVPNRKRCLHGSCTARRLARLRASSSRSRMEPGQR